MGSVQDEEERCLVDVVSSSVASVTSSNMENATSRNDMYPGRDKSIRTTDPYDVCDVTMMGDQASIPSFSGMKIPLCYADGWMPHNEDQYSDCGSGVVAST